MSTSLTNISNQTWELGGGQLSGLAHPGEHR